VSDPRTEEREQRWTLRFRIDRYRLTAPAVTYASGPWLADGTDIDVVPAARLAEVEAERDDWQRRYDALPIDANAELAGYGAALERAREALEACEEALLTGIDWCDGPMEAHMAARTKMHTARGKALAALATSSPTSTEDR
jgi:hypothetical protein